jgi:hypothetical protein
LLNAATPAAVQPLDPESRTLLNMRLAGAVLETYVELGGALGEGKPTPRTIESVASSIGSDMRRLIPMNDGWGHPLRVIGADGEIGILSFGADGVADLPYDDLQAASKPAEPGPNRDIIWVRGEFVQRPERGGDRAKKAMADMRSIGTAIESFAVDNNVYPGPTVGLRPIDEIAKTLEPIYIREVPRTDPWGQPYYVWSTGAAYLIVTGGVDALLDLKYEGAAEPGVAVPSPGPVSRDGDDLVFVNGQFVRWMKDGAL